MRILELDPPRRSVADHAFILGLMKTRNDVRDKVCKTWPAHQFSVLCKKLKLLKFIPFKRVGFLVFCAATSTGLHVLIIDYIYFLQIFEIDSTGTAAYLVVRGSVRLFSKASSASNDSKCLS